jgi:hypothetical protein
MHRIKMSRANLFIYLLPVSLQMMHANISSFVFQSSSVNLSDLRYKTTHRSDKFSFSQVIFTTTCIRKQTQIT